MTQRNALPARRPSETFKLRHGDQRSAYHITLGYYADHSLGEVFISTNSVGTAIDAMARDIAVLMSLACSTVARLRPCAMRSRASTMAAHRPSPAPWPTG